MYKNVRIAVVKGGFFYSRLLVKEDLILKIL